MSDVVNRVIKDLREWPVLEEQLNGIFQHSVKDKSILKEKLKFFDEIAAKYRNVPANNNLEAITLRSLDNERRKIARETLTGFQYFLRLVTAPFIEKKLSGIIDQNNENNLRELKQLVFRKGFGLTLDKMTERIRQGLDRFTIPISYLKNTFETVNYELSFSKVNGSYKFDGFQASLKDDSKPGVKLKQFFNNDDGKLFNASQAHNLLAGRCIHIDSLNVLGLPERTAYRLDLNDSDANGNHVIKSYVMDTGHQLRDAVNSLSASETRSYELKEQLITSLLNGDRNLLTSGEEENLKKIYVEYSPTEPHNLKFSSIDNKKITLKDALEFLNSGLETAVNLLEKATQGTSLEKKTEVAAKIDLTKAADKNKSFVSSMKTRRDKKSNRSRVSR